MAKPITAEPLNFVKYTGIGSGTAGAAAAVIAGYEIFKKGGLSEPVLIGALGALGLAIVAVAIAAAGDALARAYVTAWTSEVKVMGGMEVRPAMEAAVLKLSEAAQPALKAADNLGKAGAIALKETTTALTDAYVTAHVSNPGTAEARPALTAAAGKLAAAYEGRDSGAHEASTARNAIETIRRLGELRDLNLLNDDEFQQKKAELLDRV